MQCVRLSFFSMIKCKTSRKDKKKSLFFTRLTQTGS